MVLSGPKMIHSCQTRNLRFLWLLNCPFGFIHSTYLILVPSQLKFQYVSNDILNLDQIQVHPLPFFFSIFSILFLSYLLHSFFFFHDFDDSYFYIMMSYVYFLIFLFFLVGILSCIIGFYRLPCYVMGFYKTRFYVIMTLKRFIN